MEEINSMILHGCKLARELESNINNLPNFANQSNILSKSCDDIARIFTAARDRLHYQGSTSGGGRGHEPQMAELGGGGGGGVQEWLRYGAATAAQEVGFVQLPESRVAAEMERRGLTGFGELGGRDMEGSMGFRGGDGGEVQAMDVSDSGRGSPSQRPRRRRDDVDRRTVRMPAPRMGNLEIPPDDNFTWRKYGQKEILGSRYPRAYYRCTHQKLYQCPAKKQVQRLDDDPFTFEVTYRGEHTCHMSATAPSVAPPPSDITPHMTQQPTSPPPPSSAPLRQWLSMDINPTGEGIAVFAEQMHRQFSPGGVGSSGGGGAGPSTVRYNVDYQLPVTDLADAMFNSGSSSHNSMDLLFPSMEDKWEQGDKKN